MDDVLAQITLFFDVLPQAVQAAAALVAGASAVTALTPTPRDDTAIGKIYQLLELIALNIGRAKDVPPNRR